MNTAGIYRSEAARTDVLTTYDRLLDRWRSTSSAYLMDGRKARRNARPGKRSNGRTWLVLARGDIAAPVTPQAQEDEHRRQGKLGGCGEGLEAPDGKRRQVPERRDRVDPVR